MCGAERADEGSDALRIVGRMCREIRTPMEGESVLAGWLLAFVLDPDIAIQVGRVRRIPNCETARDMRETAVSRWG
eukprot:1185241-Prymnesium_polylepis.2